MRRVVGLLAVVVLALGLAACDDKSEPAGGPVDREQVDSVAAPADGACRRLTPADVAAPTNATRTVACDGAHNAQTFLVEDLPDEVAAAGYGSQDVASYGYGACGDALRGYLVGDESTVMRSVLGWAYFLPSQKAWDDGARWYRCDVVGGGATSERLVRLPATARGLLAGRPADRWMVCATGNDVDTGTKVPCSRRHDWRAVTTIKLGEPDEDYPGDQLVQTRTQDYCSDSVGAWLNYPDDYQFGFTWFGQAEWDAGNRRSICWARTTE
ncbi:MAG: hypothetical protein CMH83_02730 [Nocardioides sp.]|nr:hypothetical protein [Nocardioides sp.]